MRSRSRLVRRGQFLPFALGLHPDARSNRVGQGISRCIGGSSSPRLVNRSKGAAETCDRNAAEPRQTRGRTTASTGQNRGKRGRTAAKPRNGRLNFFRNRAGCSTLALAPWHRRGPEWNKQNTQTLTFAVFGGVKFKNEKRPRHGTPGLGFECRPLNGLSFFAENPFPATPGPGEAKKNPKIARKFPQTIYFSISFQR